ncbi:MAG: cupin domain-containing protein [Treponema sp.]|jgi:mannose-6-phosphate isomerase-like protein (cupin superfamily)|nr:cupin domain-containing protein [Treponema sp.]
MIIQRNDMKVEYKERMREGKGTVTVTHWVDESTQQHARLLAELSLPPGASIGLHQHNGETEYFCILAGTGVVNDDGKETLVRPGDVVITGNGASHSISNSGTVPLVLHGIIITYGPSS